MRARYLALVVAGFALSACSVKASHALMSGGLVVATGGAVAPGEHRELAAPLVSTGLAMFAIGWVLQQSSDPSSGPDPSKQVYAHEPTILDPAEAGEKLGIYRRLPADHAVFTP